MKRLIVLGVGIVLTTSALANVTQTGRYTKIKHGVTIEQSDLLAQIRHLRFPDDIKTIGEALEHLLENSGYALIERGKWKNYQQTLFSQPLPLVHRQFEPISLRQGLRLLAGSAYELIEDPLNRTVYFEVKPEFQALSYPVEDMNEDENIIAKYTN